LFCFVTKKKQSNIKVKKVRKMILKVIKKRTTKQAIYVRINVV